VILPVTFHTSSQPAGTKPWELWVINIDDTATGFSSKSTGQSRSAPPAEFRTLLHSVKTPTAHWVFLAVLLGTNTRLKFLGHSRKAAFRLPCASLLLFRRAKVLVLHDDDAVGRSAQIRRDNAVRRS
jgi:hypothetical protein